MNGLELLERLKANTGSMGIPVIVYTTSSEQWEMEECKKLGAEREIHKPNGFDRIFQNSKSGAGKICPKIY